MSKILIIYASLFFFAVVRVQRFEIMCDPGPQSLGSIFEIEIYTSNES